MDKLSYIADPKVRKPLPKALLLKDYLLDDLSSCSTNGFRSYPRRQPCCTTVRFLLEIDLKNRSKQSYNKKPLLKKSRSKSATSATMSALQRASLKVLNAVKSLPFGGVKSQSKPKKAVLSRKLYQRSFWKKPDHEEIERWKSFRELMMEKPMQEEEKADFKTTTLTVAVTDATAAAAATDSNTSTSTSNNWSDSDFTASSDNLQCSSGNSEVNQRENDAVGSEKAVVKRVGVTTATSSSTTTTKTNYSAETTKEWQSGEKEQFSPVSVMDFPCDDDDDEDDEVSSPFTRRLVHMEGTKNKLMHKLRRFESLAKLEPIDLEKRMALSESENESVGSPRQRCSFSVKEEDHERETERKAEALLRQMKLAAPSFSFKFKGLENLLLEFFRERLAEGKENDDKLMDIANGWMDGEPREIVKGWEVREHRHAYIRDMERGVMWSKVDEEEKQEVGLELEDEIFTSMLDEICLDL